MKYHPRKFRRRTESYICIVMLEFKILRLRCHREKIGWQTDRNHRVLF